MLKFGSEPNDVFFMEATSNQGVTLKRFSGMKFTIGSFYSKIVLRHLDWERPELSLDVLERFIEQVQGRKYNFSLSMLRKRQTVNLGKGNIMEEAEAAVEETTNAASSMAGSADSNSVVEKAKLIEDGRAFFCSELVVKAYKCCGILQQTDEACSNFLPGDLSS